MDALDVRIVRELTQAQTVLPARPGLAPSYRTVARALGAAPGTVRHRLDELYRSGVLVGSSVYANPALLGLESAALAARVVGARDRVDVARAVLREPGVLFVQEFHGPLLGIVFVWRRSAELRRKLARLRALTGDRAPWFGRVEFPPCARRVGPGEWRLILRLMEGPFESLRALASGLGTSVRTVQRRLDRLVRTHAILSVPTMEYRALSDCVPADLVVRFRPGPGRREAEGAVLGHVGERTIFAGLWTKFSLYSLILPSVADLARLREAVRAVPGVLDVRGEIVEQHHDRVAALRPYAEALAARAPGA